MIDKQRLFEQVKRQTAVLKPGRCLYATLIAYVELQKIYPDIVIQAGSLSWPIVPKELDDGVSPTHFSFQWSPDDPKSRWAQALGGMPEMHVWLAIPSTAEVVDMTTYEFPTLCEAMTKLPWQTPMPPDYLWVGFGSMPDNVVYEANADAIELAMYFMGRVVTSGHLKELMQ